MVRKVGYGGNSPEAASTSGPGLRRVLVTALAICVMGGVGGAVAFDGLQDGNMIAFAVGIIWCVALVTTGASKLLRHLLGLDKPKTERAPHNWTMGGDGS